jgi:hypothetical protein
MVMSKDREPIRSLAGLRKFGGSIRRALARIPFDVAVWSDVRAFPPLAVIAGLDCVAGLVLWRKYSGGPPLHMTNARLCLAGFAVAALTVAGRWWLARIEREPPAVWIRSLLMALGVLPMLTLLTLANAQHSPWAVSSVSALAVAVGGAVLLWNRLSSAPSATNAPSAPSAATFPPPMAATAPAVREPKCTLEESRHNASVRQRSSNSETWMERTIDGSGAIELQGSVHADFVAGQTIATVHVSFSPAFARLPEFSFEVVDAPSVRARTPFVYRYGARIELKRTDDSSNPARAEIRFSACVAADASRAA